MEAVAVGWLHREPEAATHPEVELDVRGREQSRPPPSRHVDRPRQGRENSLGRRRQGTAQLQEETRLPTHEATLPPPGVRPWPSVREDLHGGPARWSNAAEPSTARRQQMAQYVQLGTVRTWYDDHGDGEPLVLMHGGLVDSRFLEPNLGPLAERFHVYTPDRRGHGHTPDVDGPITYQLMAEDTIAFLEQVVGGPAHLVGHSDGAVVAMLVAMQRPDLIDRLVMISGGFDKSGEAVPDMDFDSEEVVQFLGPAYGEVSPDGVEHFRVLAGKVGQMARNEPHVDPAELARITARSLVMYADDDVMTLAHAVALFDALPDAELAVVPGTSHFLTQEKPHLVNALLLDFLTNDPVATVAPIRRTHAVA
jgi:pimeloyl-ACP methyl ester carboxylesterase